MDTVGVYVCKKLKWTGISFVLSLLFLLLVSGVGMKSPLIKDVHAKVKISAKKKQITVGKSKKLKVTGTKKKVKWSSTDTSVASVNSKGKIVANGKGNCLIVAKVAGKSLTCDTTVVPKPVKNDFTISPSSKLPDGKKNKNGDYFLLNAYLKKLESAGGGKLTLKAGTYSIKNTVYIPSNVTINCESGVKFVKASGSGSANNMFGFVPPSYAANSQKVYGYAGSHDINFYGNGASIDMKNTGQTFSIGHCQNIKIDGFNMVNMASSKYHFFEVNSSKNVSISNCNMTAANNRDSASWKECINIDSDDNDGFNAKWSSQDKTCCQNVTITSCKFKNAQGGIGTHNYSCDGSRQLYHENIAIANCTFENVGIDSSKTNAIRMMSWKNSSIKNNTFINCSGMRGCAIRLDGTYNAEISNNAFNKGIGMSLAASYNNKNYAMDKNMIYLSKEYDTTHPECVTKNLYYSSAAGSTQNAYSNLYDYYANFVKGNKVDGADMRFVEK